MTAYENGEQMKRRAERERCNARRQIEIPAAASTDPESSVTPTRQNKVHRDISRTVIFAYVCLFLIFHLLSASSSSSACVCAEAQLHMLTSTKHYCDGGSVRGHQLLQWLCGQRNYCDFQKPIQSHSAECGSQSIVCGSLENRMTDQIMGC